MKIRLKDNKVKEYPEGMSVLDIARDISPGLARTAMAGEVNGRTADIRKKIYEDSDLKILTFEDQEGKKAFWHTSSHILAQAVKNLFPEAKLAIGPAIDNGFYYDFEVDKPFSTEDLEAIEKEMTRIVKQNLELSRFELPREEALKLMQEKGESYKMELISDLPEDEVISFYRQGDFVDLCAGPHIMSTGAVKAIKLLNVAGAYWRGSEKNKMLQRIYGVSFPKKSQLTEYLNRLEEAKKRDHRKLGKDLDLFSIQEEGPGFPFFHPKGMILRNQLEDYWRKEHVRHGYQEIKSPIILKSGSLDSFRSLGTL